MLSVMRRGIGLWVLQEISALHPAFKLNLGLRDGLALCVDRNFSAVEVELDARFF